MSTAAPPLSEIDRLRYRAEAASLRRSAAEADLAATVAELAQGRAMALGDFTAAKRTRTRSGSRPRGGSADSHRDSRTLDVLRRDCQSLLRNNKLARSMVKRTCDFVVGSCVRLQAKSDDPAFNAAVEKWLRAWWEEGGIGVTPGIEHNAHRRADGRTAGRTGTQLCRLAVRSAFRDGGVLALLTSAGQVQLVEYERLKTPARQTQNPAMVNGVEYGQDGNGPVVAYHVAKWNRTGGMLGAYTEQNTQPVPAAYVLNLANPADDEVGVTIPEPGLAALVEDFELVRNYVKDTQLAARIATLFGLITKTQYPQDGGLMVPGTTATKTLGDGSTAEQREIEMQPGFVAHLKPGESIEQIDPKQPTTVFGDFVMTNLVLMGAEAGLPLVLWLMDLTKVNFASARCAVLLAYGTFAVWRRWLAERFIIPLVRWRVAMAIRRGEIEGVPAGAVPMGWDRFEVLFSPMPVLDPLMQYQAEAYAVEKGLRTFRDVVTQLTGGDFDEHLEQLAAERNRREELGILPVGTPGASDPNLGRGKPASPTRDEPATPSARPEPDDEEEAGE
jgi:capsid protein